LKTFIPFHFCFLLFFSSFPLTLFAQSPGDCILIPDIHFNSSSQISVHVTDIYSDDGSSHSAFFPENLPGNLALCPDQSATFVAFISSNAGYVLGDPGPLFPQNLDITWTLKNDTGSVLLQSPLQSFTGPLILSSTTEFLLDSSLLSSLPFGDYSVTISAIAQPPTGFPPSCVDFHLLSLSSTFLFHLIHVTSITATLSGQPLQNPASLTSDQLQPFFLTALLDLLFQDNFLILSAGLLSLQMLALSIFSPILMENRMPISFSQCHFYPQSLFSRHCYYFC
jgi:hypothetical protein